MTTEKSSAQIELDCRYDWKQVARLLLTSRAIDDLEEHKLVPERKVLYQFSARGHELAQILLGFQLSGQRDCASAYYRSRPLLLTLGVPLPDLLAAPMMKSGGYSDGRDIGVVSNLPREHGPVVLPMAGDVGSQFTPSVGWAQAIRYRSEVLNEPAWRDCLTVVLGGEASVATNGFWSSLTIATTQQLPLLFLIEDNGYGISVPSRFQTPGGNIARNLESFQGLRVDEGDGTDPESAATLIHDMVEHARRHGPALLRLRVPRLCGHSGQDTQTYKSPELLETEWATDPLGQLRSYLVPAEFSEPEWEALESETRARVQDAAEEASARPDPDTAEVGRFVFSETEADNTPIAARQGGSSTRDLKLATTSDIPQSEGTRINMVAAIRQTLDCELEVNPRVLVFGEDVGPKGGVHAATMGLQQRHGESRVFDTSLSEEGIIGRAVGMALAGLMPVPEIQFRKYADPAMEQLNNCGTIRWRTKNRFAAPIVVRMPGGFFKCGDPWHSVSSEVTFVHAIGWQVAFPSNAEDAVGLLRHAMRGEDPTIFFEHRALLDNSWARRPYPGDHFELPFGRLKKIENGTDLTVVTWGAMVERCLVAARQSGHSVDLLDLRTLSPWDQEGVLASVARTRRCLIVHEDGLSAGHGAEISATLVEQAFFDLDAPIRRIAVPDVPIPHNMNLMKALLPDPNQIASAIEELVKFLVTELIPIVLPLDQQEGTLAAIGTWLVGVGERVTQDQPLLEISTDKVSFEIAAPEAGLMAEILKIDGDEIAPGEILGRLRPETGGSVAAQPQPTPPPSASDPNPAVPDQPADQSAATRFSPAVRRALQKHQLDATLIRGSGRGGRITFQDVRGFLKERQPAAAQPALDLPPSGSTRRVPHTPMRLSIARHMVESALQKAPHVTTVFEVNFNAVLTHSRNTREGFSKQGIRLTLTSYLIAAAAHALQAVPEVNSRWHEDALEIFSDCNVGLATALGSGGLVVPVIRQAQNLDLFGIAAQLQELTERARKGRLSSADMEGGTFTITNHGVSGSLIATPIINQPQTAILGAGKIEKRIRVRETSEGDSMQIQPMAYVTLSIDHRALDGFTANQFLSSFCARLEGWADPS